MTTAAGGGEGAAGYAAFKGARGGWAWHPEVMGGATGGGGAGPGRTANLDPPGAAAVGSFLPAVLAPPCLSRRGFTSFPHGYLPAALLTSQAPPGNRHQGEPHTPTRPRPSAARPRAQHAGMPCCRQGSAVERRARPAFWPAATAHAAFPWQRR